MLSAALGLIVLLSKTLRRQLSATTHLGIVIAFGSLVYWFQMAPDIRFGGVFFWILLALLGSVLLSVVERPLAHKLATAVAALVVANTFGALDFALPVEPNWNSPLPGIAVLPTKPTKIENGQEPPLIINAPVGSDMCGDAPLPCTNYGDKQKWRVPGKLGRGFLP